MYKIAIERKMGPHLQPYTHLESILGSGGLVNTDPICLLEEWGQDTRDFCIWLRVENQLKRAKFRMEIQDAVGGAKRSIKIEFRT